MALTLTERKRKQAKLERIDEQTALLMTGASGLLLADMVMTTSWISVDAVAVGATGVSTLIWQSEFDNFLSWARTFNRKYHFSSLLLLAIGTLFLL
jgi:3-methyladenine DNA glycosylase AlkD